jgi:signal transduction histidine kinase
MSTAAKLWLGFGLLLALLVGTGLFVAHRLATIERALATIMAVQEPVTATTYDMAINVSRTSALVFHAVSSAEPAPRALIASDQAAFERLIARYDGVARSAVSRDLGHQIHLTHVQFATLADSLMALRDEQKVELTECARGAEALEAVLARDLRARLDGRGKDGSRKLIELAALESPLAGIGNELGLNPGAPDAARRARVAALAQDFRAALARFAALRVNDAERQAAGRAGALFAEYLARVRSALDGADQLHRVLGRFSRTSSRLQTLVDEGIHSLARTDLIEAQRSARRAIHVSMLAVLGLLVAGIITGSLTALPVARSVVGSERALRLRMKELALTHRRKDEFLGMLGHELRNPLAPLRHSLHRLETEAGRVPGDVQRVHAVMKRQVQTMTRLVDDLLDVSRVTEGKITLRREPVELGSLLDQAGEDHRPLASSQGKTLEVVRPGADIWVYADPARMAQMVGNLLNNAIQYSRPGGHIALTLEAAGDQARVRVSDDGIGIEPDMLPRIFEPFTQLDGSLTREHSGLGLGLALVRRLAELHGGRVRAESPGPDQGSTFTLELPRIAAPEIGAAGREAAPAPPATPRRVLVVDDNRDSAESLADLIRLWGHEAHVAHDGADALERMAECDPEVVLLDIGLPGIDGYQVARRLRELQRGAGLTLIALTGLGRQEDRRRAREAGFDVHLTKPVDPDALRDWLARAPA